MLNQRTVDDALVVRFKAGERKVFDLLAAKYQHRLLRAVSRIVQNQSDAEDVVQETLMRAYRGLPTFRMEAAFYTWFFQIGINTAKNLRRRQAMRAHVSVQLDSEADGLPDGRFVTSDNCSPQALLENKQTVGAIHAALKELPPIMSDSLTLCEVDGLSYAQIAQVMSCPMGTVRSRISRARELVASKVQPLLDPQLNRVLWVQQ
jgi:RNA polymerase sigma-70 factor (ECF subfamily)